MIVCGPLATLSAAKLTVSKAQTLLIAQEPSKIEVFFLMKDNKRGLLFFVLLGFLSKQRKYESFRGKVLHPNVGIPGP